MIIFKTIAIIYILSKKLLSEKLNLELKEPITETPSIHTPLWKKIKPLIIEKSFNKQESLKACLIKSYIYEQNPEAIFYLGYFSLFGYPVLNQEKKFLQPII